MKSRRSSTKHFAYGDPRDGYNKYGRRKITIFQFAVFVIILIGIIFLAILTLSHQYTDIEFKKAFDVDGR